MSNYGVPDNNNNGMLPYHQANNGGVSGGQQPYYAQTNAQYQQQNYGVQNYNMMPQQQMVYNQPGNPQVYNQYQQYQSNGNSSVQQQQPVYYQQIPQQQQYNNQQQYAYQHQQQYANYNNAAAQLPPPPPNQTNQYHNTQNNTNANAAASLRQSLSSTSNHNNNNNKPESKPPKKKVNPKMAKKYSGKGLKTITISGPGLPTQRFKVCVGNHPDDIKKWIEERKKRFPRRDGSHKKCNTSSSSLAGMKRSRLEDEKEDDENGKRPCLDNSTVKSEVAKLKSEAGGLSSLLAGYGSSSSDDEDESNNSPTGKADTATSQDSVAATLETSNNSPPKRLCTYYQRGKCRHGTSCIFLHSDKPINNTTQNNKRQSQSERDKARNQYEEELKTLGLATPSHGSRYTSGGKVINNTSLLHQLLARDKERERSLTLQLLRYIVDCDYFQKDGNDNASTRQSDDNHEQSSGEDSKDTAKETTLK